MAGSSRRLLQVIPDILTREYRSRLDPYIRWARHPFAVLVGALIAAILCALYLHPRAWLLAMSLSAVLILGSVWPWLSLRGVTGTISFSYARVREGDPAEVIVTLRSRMPWGSRGLYVFGIGGGERSKNGLACIAGKRTTEFRWRFVPERRGEYPADRPEIGTAFPFGLRTASRPLAVSSRLLVWPRTFRVGPLPDAVAGRERDGIAPRRVAGTVGDLMGLRPYRRGDSLRRVHWPQSARHGRLVVCELESMAAPEIQIVVDTAKSTHAGSGPDGTFEWCIRIAASFADAWIVEGADVELVFGEQSIASMRGTLAARRACLLDALARLPYGELPLRDVLESPKCRRFDGGLRLVVTTDRAANTLAGTEAPKRAEHFIVLQAAAFAELPDRTESIPPTIQPWIWISNPDDVPGGIQRIAKEAVVVR